MDLIFYIPACIVLVAVFSIVQHLVIYLHDAKQLRKYPALNSFCGITNLGYIFELWRSDRFRSRAIAEAHQTSSIIRLGPNALSFSDVRAIKDIYGHSTSCSKGDMYSTPAGPHRSLLDCVEKQQHSEKRRRLAAAFATKHLEEWEHKIADKCIRLVAQLDQHCTARTGSDKSSHASNVDFRKWFNLFTIEAIADIALSEHLGFLESGDDIIVVSDGKGDSRQLHFIQSLHGLGRMAAPIVWSSNGYRFLKTLASALSPSYWNEVVNNNNFDAIVHQLTTNRLRRHTRGEKIDDFFTCLVEDRQGTSTNLELGEITAEVSVFLNAGSDTTAIALTHALYYLLKNPDKLHHLREELHLHLSAEGVIPSYASVKNLAYLRACLDESLRLSPPVSFGLERKTPPEGMSINGTWISGDTLVSVPAYLAHRDPSIFPDSESFIPERWLTEESKAVQKYFIPFSTGSRGCIGRNISYIEQHVLLAALVRRYDFALPHATWTLQWEERFNLWPSAMPLRINLRDT